MVNLSACKGFERGFTVKVAVRFLISEGMFNKRYSCDFFLNVETLLVIILLVSHFWIKCISTTFPLRLSYHMMACKVL